MHSPTLLVLAAGMGSRFGGLKQIDPVGPAGESLLDFSVHDARKAGFGRVVFVIRRDIETEFRERIGRRYAKSMHVDYVFQQLEDLPHGFATPQSRSKPWGTAHAVWCARHTINEPFAAINADDFYGAAAFAALADFLGSVPMDERPASFALAGYRLEKTLSDHGTVARGLCDIDNDGLLRGVEELTEIARRADGTIACGQRLLDAAAPVSMNFWGFTPQVFPLLESSLLRFLSHNSASEKAEHYLPSAVADFISEESATIRLIATDADWFGVTYREDRPRVVDSIAKLVSAGLYR